MIDKSYVQYTYVINLDTHDVYLKRDPLHSYDTLYTFWHTQWKLYTYLMGLTMQKAPTSPNAGFWIKSFVRVLLSVGEWGYQK